MAERQLPKLSDFSTCKKCVPNLSPFRRGLASADDEVGPPLHNFPALLQQVRPLIGLIGFRPFVVGSAKLDDIAGEAGCLRAPIFKARTEAVDSVAVAAVVL